MEQIEELELADILVKLKRNGYSVFAQYDFLRGEEIFRGIFISPCGKDAKEYLKRVIEIITTQKGLGEKPR